MIQSGSDTVLWFFFRCCQFWQSYGMCHGHSCQHMQAPPHTKGGVEVISVVWRLFFTASQMSLRHWARSKCSKQPRHCLALRGCCGFNNPTKQPPTFYPPLIPFSHTVTLIRVQAMKGWNPVEFDLVSYYYWSCYATAQIGVRWYQLETWNLLMPLIKQEPTQFSR